MQHDMVLDFGVIDFSAANWASGRVDFPTDVDLSDLYTVNGTTPIKHKSAGGQMYLNLQAMADANGARVNQPGGGYGVQSLDIYLWYTGGSAPTTQPMLLEQRAGTLSDLSEWFGAPHAVMAIPPFPGSDVAASWTNSVVTCAMIRGGGGTSVLSGAVRAWVGGGPVGFVGV